MMIAAPTTRHDEFNALTTRLPRHSTTRHDDSYLTTRHDEFNALTTRLPGHSTTRHDEFNT